MAKKTVGAKAKADKHPKMYTIFKPNELIKAKKLDMNLMEQRVYNEILNNNHKDNPDQLTYKVEYKFVFDITDVDNRMHNIRRISRNLQRRIFYFDREFMMEHFGENADASMVPFPGILYRDDCFEVELYKDFKKILSMIHARGFTKGDIETLRSFTHEISNAFYWVIRQKQVFHNVWEVELEELKEMLGLAGKYEVYSNFKTKILDIAQEEFRDKWVEFEYQPIRKGQGGAVRSIKFIFKRGPADEKERPVGDEYEWEATLQAFGVNDEKVKMVCHRVRAAVVSELDFVWDQEYVKYSIEGMKMELAEKKKNAHKNQIKNVGGWVYSGLVNGQWLDHVNARRQRIQGEVQQSLFPDAVPVVLPPVAKVVSAGSDGRTMLDSQAVVDWNVLYIESKMADKKTFEEFMASQRIYKEGENWVRVG